MLAGAMLILLVVAQSGEGQSTLPTDPELRQTTISRVLEKLQSNDAVESAWGAYQAGDWNLKQHVPALLELVKRENQRPPDASPFTQKMALDALVRLGADVPSDLLLARLDKEYYSETLILLAKVGLKSRGTLLRFMDELPMDGQHWWATARILTAARAPGIARRVLNGVQFELTFFVRDSVEQVYRYGAYVSHNSRRNFRDYQKSLPPWPEYYFYPSLKDGRIVLRNDPVGVSYSRSEFSSRRPPEKKTPPIYRSHLAIECLQAMLKRPMKELSKRKAVTIDWNDEEHFLRQARKGIEEIRSVHQDLLERLTYEGLLTDKEKVGLEPDIKIVVEDKRKVKDIALPKVGVHK
jgi:hypothetical protein